MRRASKSQRLAVSWEEEESGGVSGWQDGDRIEGPKVQKARASLTASPRILISRPRPL